MAKFEPKQIAGWLNEAIPSRIGESAQTADEDLRNIVDVGRQFDSVDTKDFITGQILVKMARWIMRDRVYSGITLPPIMKEGWEFGSMRVKTYVKNPRIMVDNQNWKLQDGRSYDQDIYHKMEDVVSGVWEKYTTWAFDRSIPTDQMNQAFTSREEFMKFWNMVATSVENEFLLNKETLVKTVYMNLIGETIYSDYSGGTLSAGSHLKSKNLFFMYKQLIDANPSFTADKAIYNGDFLKFAAMIIKKDQEKIQHFRTLYNIAGADRFTPSDKQTLVLLDDVKAAVGPYLYTPSFNKEDTLFPNAFGIDSWQSCSNTDDFASCSTVDVITADNHNVKVENVLGVLHDNEAVGICCEEQTTDAHTNTRAGFTNLFHKQKAMYIQDKSENAIVYFCA